jgi:hypothetical protein
MSAAARTHPFAISTNGIMTDIDTTSPAGTLPPNDGGPGYNYSLAGTRMHVTRAYRPPPWEAHPSQRPSHDRDMAMLTGATWEHRDRLLREAPWTPFPQNDCTFTFGPDRRPLPVGALITLWDRWDAMTGDCPECGAPALGVSFGAGLSVGGIRGCCPRCARSTRRMVEGCPHPRLHRGRPPRHPVRAPPGSPRPGRTGPPAGHPSAHVGRRGSAVGGVGPDVGRRVARGCGRRPAGRHLSGEATMPQRFWSHVCPGYGQRVKSTDPTCRLCGAEGEDAGWYLSTFESMARFVQALPAEADRPAPTDDARALRSGDPALSALPRPRAGRGGPARAVDAVPRLRRGGHSLHRHGRGAGGDPAADPGRVPGGRDQAHVTAGTVGPPA